ncbi:hypothetical protein FQR65_LT06499 [Abscondita terminalis]|nr:hypothetical protein FQR65_LT06499 [Abscondita terminalis]
MFHGSIYDQKIHGKPQVRNLNQRYIYFNTEAPPNKFEYNPDFTLFNNFYNWTITNRLDSDITSNYGIVCKSRTWFVSHCSTASKREDLVKAIQKHVSVDIYGGCGNLSCPKNGVESSDYCYDLLDKHYKFYLSFENSLCKDYFTEKLYFVLPRTIIPIVYGGHNETILAPPNSFINVKDFKDVKTLVDYMLFLHANTTEYLKYFRWRKDYVISSYPTNCELCRKLNEPQTPKIYENFYDWNWGNTSHPLCLVDDDLPAIVRTGKESDNN